MAKNVAVYLPEELLSNIFLRLGVKSLVQCKSVCRTWLSVISNPHFVKSQLRLAMMNPTLLIIDYPRTNPASLSRRRSYVKTFPHLALPCRFEHCEVISCSYNGIICLCNDDDDVFYLWNPSIGEFKMLPPAPPRHLLRYDKIGFGYDSISDDYKIVRMVYENLCDVMPTVHLYSANTDSWRRFQDPLIKLLSRYDSTDIVVNGVLYFDDGDELISFDLHKEVFGLVTLPSFFETKRSNILDFEGSVAIVFESDSDAQGMYLWMLEDVSGQMQWNKNFRINAFTDRRLWLYCYLSAGDFHGRMAYRVHSLHNILYDYKTEETKIFGVRENVCATLKYTQTLVSLDGFEPVE